ncbi:MAG: hypothetical protein IPK83_23895 [Planctomycetes bacterium]|nr:hypothetical protein [Planctomycetota bacterium]
MSLTLSDFLARMDRHPQRVPLDELTRPRELREGQVCGSQDADIHQISNLQPGSADLVTLHVYSPPLMVMGTYSLLDQSVGEFADPVFEFCHGAGI